MKVTHGGDNPELFSIAGGEDSDDSDGDGRAGAFGRSNQHAGKGFQERRAEMLLASPNGKRKKKKRKKGSQTDPA